VAAPRPGPAPGARAAPAEPPPRLRVGAADVTPPREPLPAAAVDRLVRVRLAPGVTGTVPIVLRGACAGTMAKIAASSATQIDTAGALTCVDDPGALVPPPILTPHDAPAPPSVTGTFLADTCAPGESDDQVVCVPGGDTVLGGLGVDGVTSGAGDPMATSPLPMRLAGLHKFWIDRTEVTVGRYRQALAAGFVATAAFTPPPNNGPLAARYSWQNGLGNATFSDAPLGRESYPLNMATWSFARQLCAFYGGTLPSEAQWEYAAVAAGRSTRATFPWGEEQPDCTLGVANRNPDLTVGTICPGPPLEPIDSPASMRDTNALGVRGLGGGVVEWTLDAAARYDAPCWQASPAIDPSCVDPEAPLRVHRGGSFVGPFFMTRAIVRDAFATNGPESSFGARCVYAQPPAKRWRGP
jgi:formylglycine-generating enzyme required for sulfatase activity